MKGIYQLLSAYENYVMHITYHIAFNPDDNPVRWVLVAQFYK